MCVYMCRLGPLVRFVSPPLFTIGNTLASLFCSRLWEDDGLLTTCLAANVQLDSCTKDCVNGTAQGIKRNLYD
jgi:hypothetical protein